MRIPFLSQLGAGRSANVDAQLLENWYEEEDSDNPRQPSYLIQTPGLSPFTDFSGSFNTRAQGIHYFNGYVLVATSSVVDAELLKCTLAPVPVVTSVGTFTGFNANDQDYVQMIDNGPHNGKQVWICDNAAAWVYAPTGGTLTKMSATQGYPSGGVSWITQQDTFGIFGRAGTSQFYVTDSFNFANVSAGNFAQAQTITDVLVAGLSDNTRLYLWGQSGMEIWYNSGAVNFTFTRIPGAIYPIGCSGSNTPQVIDNSVVWVGNNSWGGISVFQIRGENAPQIISTPQIDYLLNRNGNAFQFEFNPEFAYATVYKDEGHEFYILHTGTGYTIVWDASTGKWHQRISELPLVASANDWAGGAMDYVPPTDTSSFFDTTIVALPEVTGGIGFLADDWGVDWNSTLINRVIQSPHINDQDKRLFINNVQVIASFGPGNQNQPGITSGTLTLSYSKDNGNTFPSTQTFTVTSNNIQRMLFRRLGWARDWVFRLVYSAASSITPPLVIMNAFADVMYRTDGNPGTPG